MKHAQSAALDTIEAMLASLRTIAGISEKKRGVFYRGSQAFLHFHEDPQGMFADVRIAAPGSGDEWQRLQVNSRAEQRALVALVKRGLGRHRRLEHGRR